MRYVFPFFICLSVHDHSCDSQGPSVLDRLGKKFNIHDLFDLLFCQLWRLYFTLNRLQLCDSRTLDGSTRPWLSTWGGVCLLRCPRWHRITFSRQTLS